ncbi:MAG: tripartite tricarboxylate transporter TctB family protein [Candidatus Limnocylindria bacterium]
MRLRHPDAIGGIAIAAIGAVALAAALATPDPGFGVVGPAALPSVLAVLIVATGAWLLVATLRAPAAPEIPPLDRRPLLLAAVALAIFLALFIPLGFLLSSALFLVVMARILGSRATLRDGVAGIAFVVALYLLFDRLLTVTLPRGPLPF